MADELYSRRALINFTPSFLELVDSYADLVFKSRSEFVMDSLQHYINYLDKKAKKG